MRFPELLHVYSVWSVTAKVHLFSTYFQHLTSFTFNSLLEPSRTFTTTCRQRRILQEFPPTLLAYAPISIDLLQG